MTALLLFARRYWRVLAIAAAVAWLLVGIQRCTNAAERRGYQRATAEMAARVAKANAATAALEQRQRKQSDAASAAWETQRNELQNRIDTITARKPVVRLCKPAASGSQLPGAASPTGSFDDAAGQRIDAVQVGADIGGAATVLAGECERYREQLSALQRWISGSR